MSSCKKLKKEIHQETEVAVIKADREKYDCTLEPLLCEDSNRFVTDPILYSDISDMYKKAKTSFWTTEKVPNYKLMVDQDHFNNLHFNEKLFISNVLAFLNGTVNKNLIQKFSQTVKLKEAQYFYDFQIVRENVHSEMYSLLNKTYISDQRERNFYFDEIKVLSCVKKKNNWILNWVNDNNVIFSERVIASAITESIFFSGSSAAIFWFKEKNSCQALPLVINSSHEIKLKLHYNFACLMFKYVEQKPSFERVKLIIMDAVEIEKEFLMQALSVDLMGINRTHMYNYIEFIADKLFVTLGFKKVYYSENPFSFINFNFLEDNFFEGRIPVHCCAIRKLQSYTF